MSSVAPGVADALRLAHQRLTELGIAHVLCGGLAVNHHGHPYATHDVDWLVGDDVLDQAASTIIHVFAPGVPVRIHDIAIDYLHPDIARRDPAMEAELEAALANARQAPGSWWVLDAPLLIYMKLLANRPKDIAAVEGLLQAGAVEIDHTDAFLAARAPTVADRFRRIVARLQ